MNGALEGADAGRSRRRRDGPDNPEAVWTTKLTDARTAGTPSITDGTVYVPVDAVSDRAHYDYRLHALEASTGEERWQASLRSDPNPSPAVDGHSIVVSARRGSESSRLVAFDAHDGNEQWLYDVDARVTAPPTVDGTTVYLPDWEGYVHAVSKYGSEHWSR